MDIVPIKIKEEIFMEIGVVIVLAVLLFTVVFFVTEWLPLSVTAMIGAITLGLFDVVLDNPFGDKFNPFSGFINKNVILFVTMFIIGGAMFKTGMANKIGGVVTKFAKTERQLIVAVMIITGIMSGFLSNTGTAAILIPVLIGIAAKNNFSRSKLLLPLILAAAMGGNLSMIGAPGNLVGHNQLEAANMTGFGFFEYAIVGLPILIIGTLYVAFIGHKHLPHREPHPESDSGFQNHDFSDIPAWKQWMSLIVLLTVVVFMAFINPVLKSSGMTQVPLPLIGAVGAAVLILTGVITEKEAYNSIDLKTIFLFGGTLALASALQKSGTGAVIADSVVKFLGGNPNPYVLLATLFILGALMTNFMSNTATTTLLVPIGFAIAQSLNVDPRSVIMATVIGCSVGYATPIAMPANAMVFNVGGFKFMDYVRIGVPLILVAMGVSFVVLPIVFPF